MNKSKVDAALGAIARAAHELALMCDRDLQEYAGVWHGISSEADELRSGYSLDDLDTFSRGIGGLLSHRPISFGEAYIQRDDFAEQEAENEKLDQLKRRIGKAASEMWAAAREGEVNKGAVRRHLTEVETVLLDAKVDAEAARRLREFLSAGETDLQAAEVLADEFARREWPAAVRQRVLGLVSRLKWELAPEPDRPWKRE